MRTELRGIAVVFLLGAAGNAVAGMSPEFPPASAKPSPRELVAGLTPREPGAPTAAARATLSERLAASGFEIVATLAPAAESAREATRRNPFALDPSRVILLRGPESMPRREALARLAADPAIEWAEPNHPREFCDFPADGTLPDDPLMRDTRQWGLWNAGAAGVYRGLAGADVGARAAWALTCGSNDVVLAVADTGVDPNHPDLQRTRPDGAPRLAWGRCVSSDGPAAWADPHGHGTAVAGVMAALTHDGAHFDSLGVAGLCGGDGGANTGCRLVPIKITTGAGSTASSFDIARAIVYATSVGARAVNLSFAGSAASRVERMALTYALTRGCVVVAASGNRGHLGPGVLYPAAFAADGLCIAVGASDPRDRRAMFSSYGPSLDLVAPGVEVWTTSLTYPNAFGARYPGCLAASGTSFAAPHVTGAIGLMASLRPDLTDTDFQQLLRATARDLGAPGRDDETGWGRLDAAAAVRAVADAPGRALALWHDERPAVVRPTGRFATLTLAADSFGTFDRAVRWSGRMAERFEATVTFTLPDSFADSARVWTRVGGTTTLRGDFRFAHFAPWAEVAERRGREVTLRGFLYRVPAIEGDLAADSADLWLPLPPDQARIGFTVFGPRIVAPPQAAAVANLESPLLRAWPNPAPGPIRIAGRPGERVAIVDLAGRRVHVTRLDPVRGEAEWIPADQRVRPGLYFAGPIDRRGPLLKLVVLGPH